jgi:hypothetical protein
MDPDLQWLWDFVHWERNRLEILDLNNPAFLRLFDTFDSYSAWEEYEFHQRIEAEYA